MTRVMIKDRSYLLGNYHLLVTSVGPHLPQQRKSLYVVHLAQSNCGQ
jgi:hypothetical protein